MTTLALQKDKTIKIIVKKEKEDIWVQGWVPTKSSWFRLVDYEQTYQDTSAPDSFIRYLVRGDKCVGWLVYINERWTFTDKDNITVALKSLGMAAKDVPPTLGSCVLNPWYEATVPFGKEYLGDRKWNRKAPQLIQITTEEGPYPSWSNVLSHVGEGLTLPLKENAWAKKNRILTGEHYLLLWIASFIRFPFEPLPYLFLFSNQQETGKSIFHEGLSLIFQDEDLAMIRGGDALLSSGRFNAELKGKVLAVLEEVNLSQKKSIAYNRIKDWVTTRRLLIHPKGETPFMYPNTTHWIHCANKIRFCPVFPGDTRINFLKVNSLEKEIPKPKLLKKLAAELPQFLHAVKTVQIPESPSRLFIPVIDTFEKLEYAEQQRSLADIWWNTQTYQADGYAITLVDAYERFKEAVSDNIKFWPKSRFFQDIPDTFLIGKTEHGKYVSIANRSFKPQTIKHDKLFKRDGNLVTRELALKIDNNKILAGNLAK